MKRFRVGEYCHERFGYPVYDEDYIARIATFVYLEDAIEYVMWRNSL